MSGTDTIRSNILTYPHGFSTRLGGVSEGPFDSLNLGMNRGDEPEKVKENYRRFLSSCGIDCEDFVCGKKVHGNNVMIVGKEQARPPYGYDELFEAGQYYGWVKYKTDEEARLHGADNRVDIGLLKAINEEFNKGMRKEAFLSFNVDLYPITDRCGFKKRNTKMEPVVC